MSAAHVSVSAGERPSSARTRLDPLDQAPVARPVPDDTCERVLASAPAQPTADLVSLGIARRALVAESIARRGTYDGDCERLRFQVREAIAALAREMRLWLSAKVASKPRKGSVFEWLVNLPASIASCSACAGSLSLRQSDIEWLVRKCMSSLLVLLASREEQIAHVIRKRISVEECDGHLERIGRLSGYVVPSIENDWLAAFSRARIGPTDVADYLLALSVYTTDCSTRDEVDGWEHSGREGWRPPTIPARIDIHGPNASPWAVMNWTLRVTHDASAPANVRALAAESFVPFSLLRDRIDEALAILPKVRTVVYRGVNIPGLSYRYAPALPVVFPPFTSTSTVGTEAREYVKDDGTFFVIRSHSAAFIDFVSFLPAESEKLLPTFSRFSVLQKTSTTVLRMLGCRYDIVTLAEDGDVDATDTETVKAFARSVRETRFIYEAYLRETYVEGRIGPTPPPCSTSVGLFTSLSSWCDGDRNLLLLGVGGSGKTSAVLAAYCRLAERDGLLPVFVPLPLVSGLLETDGALDAYLCQALRLTAPQLDLLGKLFKLVLLLESLDEVRIPLGLSPIDVKDRILRLVARNSFCARKRIMLSCRDEFLSRYGLLTSDIFGRHGEVRYVQPFMDSDVSAFCEKQCAKTGLTGERKTKKIAAVDALRLALREALWNPCVLHMACRTDDARIHAMIEGAGRIPSACVYEAHLLQEMEGSDVALQAMQALAVSMLNRNEWHVSVRDVASAFADFGVSAATFRASFFPRIPRRVENDGDDSASFAWWHKSIGEYLASRALWRAPEDSLGAVGRAFSLDTPAVLSFFGSMALLSPAHCAELCNRVMVPAVLNSRVADDTRARARASNALALLCASGHVLAGRDLANIVIEDANLEDAWLHGVLLRGAVFRRCNLARACFDFADVTDVQFPHSTCELALRPFVGHTDALTKVLYSPDGLFIASASADKTIRRWNSSTGKEEGVFRGHAAAVTCLDISASGTMLISGSTDRTVRIWDVAAVKEIRSVRGHLQEVTGVCFAGEDKVFVSASVDFSVKVWDLSTCTELRVMRAHESAVGSLCASPDGKYVASGSAEGSTVRLWDVTTGRTVHVIKGKGNAGCFSADGKLLLGESNSSVYMYEMATGETVRWLTGHSDRVTALSVSADGKYVATSSKDGTVRLWNSVTAGEVASLRGHRGDVTCVCFSPSAKNIASGSIDGTLRVWNSASGSSVRRLDGPGEIVTCVRMSHDGRLVATASDVQILRMFDAMNASELWSVCAGGQPCTAQPDSRRAVLCFSHDSKHIAAIQARPSAAAGNAVNLFHAGTGALVWSQPVTCDVTCVCYSADGRLLGCGLMDGSARVLDVSDGTVRGVLEGMSGAVTQLCFTADGAFLVGGSSGGRATCTWNISTKAIVSPPVPTHTITAVCFTSDNKSVVCVSAGDTLIRVWDFATGKLLKTIAGTTSSPSGVSVSSDGKMLTCVTREDANLTLRQWNTVTWKVTRDVTAGKKAAAHTLAQLTSDGKYAVSAGGQADRKIRMWDAATGKEVRFFKGPENGVSAIGLSSDGETLVASSRGGSIRVWTVTNGRGIGAFDIEGSASPLCVCVAGSGRRVVAGMSDHCVLALDLDTGAIVHTLLGHHSSVTFIATCPDGGRVVTAAETDLEARVWDILKGCEVTVLSGHTAAVTSLCFSPDGKCIATGSRDRTVCLWDAFTGARVQTIEYQPTFLPISGLVRGPGESIVACGNLGSLIRTWSLSTGAMMNSSTSITPVNISGVRMFELSPDGALVVGALSDKGIALWDALTGSVVWAMDGHAQPITSASFACGVSRLITAAADKSVRVWNLSDVTRKYALPPSMKGIVKDATRREEGVLTRIHYANGVATSSSPSTALLNDEKTAPIAPGPFPLVSLIQRQSFFSCDNVVGSPKACDGMSPGLYSAFEGRLKTTHA